MDERRPATTPPSGPRLAEQLRLPGLAIPEEYGGDGFGLVELGVVLEEMGRALLRAPFFATVVLAAQALLASGDDGRLRARTSRGSPPARPPPRLAVAEDDGSWDRADLARAVPDG